MNYIFDFDGTLADTLGHVIIIFDSVSKRSEPLSPQEIDALRKMSSRQAIKTARIPSWKVPWMIRRGMKSFTEQIPTMKTFAGLPEVLAAMQARGDKLYIATSNTQPNVEQFLAQHDMARYFSGMRCGAKLFGKAKYIKGLMKAQDMDPAHTMYIGDETRDVAAGHKAGIKVASVTWGFNHPDILHTAGAEFVVDTPAQLLDLVL